MASSSIVPVGTGALADSLSSERSFSASASAAANFAIMSAIFPSVMGESSCCVEMTLAEMIGPRTERTKGSDRTDKSSC